jgi:hypothetical protein
LNEIQEKKIPALSSDIAKKSSIFTGKNPPLMLQEKNTGAASMEKREKLITFPLLFLMR